MNAFGRPDTRDGIDDAVFHQHARSQRPPGNQSSIAEHLIATGGDPDIPHRGSSVGIEAIQMAVVGGGVQFTGRDGRRKPERPTGRELPNNAPGFGVQRRDRVIGRRGEEDFSSAATGWNV